MIDYPRTSILLRANRTLVEMLPNFETLPSSSSSSSVRMRKAFFDEVIPFQVGIWSEEFALFSSEAILTWWNDDEPTKEANSYWRKQQHSFDLLSGWWFAEEKFRSFKSGSACSETAICSLLCGWLRVLFMKICEGAKIREIPLKGLDACAYTKCFVGEKKTFLNYTFRARLIWISWEFHFNCWEPSLA